MAKSLLVVFAVSTSLLLTAGIGHAATPPSEKPRGDTHRAAAASQRPFRVVTMKHADADALVKGLNAVLAPAGARMVAYPRTNSIIVVASPELQRTLVELLAQLDVPPGGQGSQAAAWPADSPPPENPPTPAPVDRLPANGRPTNERDAAVAAIRVQRIDPNVLSRILEGTQGAGQNGLAPNGTSDPSTVTVMRASPATKRALERLGAQMSASGANGLNPPPATSPPANTPPPSVPPLNAEPGRAVSPDGSALPPPPSQPGEVRVLRIPGIDAEAVAKALASLSAGEGNRNVVVVVPQRPAQQGQTEVGASPGAVRR